MGNPGFDTYYYIATTLAYSEHPYSELDLLEAYYLGSIYAGSMLMGTTFGVGATNLSDEAKNQIFNVVPVYWGFIREHQVVERVQAQLDQISSQ